MSLLKTSICLIVAFATVSAVAQVDDESYPDIELHQDNYAVWRDRILPAQEEMNWQQIPWLTTFRDGILAADREQKPLLLWTMNGHPLGNT